jgi:Phosphotransferase enzyme family
MPLFETAAVMTRSAAPAALVAPPQTKLQDDRLPAIEVILGPEIVPIMALAIAEAGGSLEALDRRQVLYKPGRQVVARFAARVAWQGQVTDETLVAAAGAAGPPVGSLVVGDGELTVGVWRWPFDPYLPGLASAMEPDRVRAVVADLGGDPGPVRLTPMAYRPGRRAVVRAVVGEQVLYFKIVPTDEAEALHQRHVAVAGRLPTPVSLGWSPSLGLLALEALPGQVLRETLLSGRSAPAPEALIDLLDEVADLDGAALERVAARPTSVERAAGHALVLEAILPDQRDRLRRLVDRLGDVAPVRPGMIHGDLHDSQLLVRDGDISGLLDIDGLGPGDRLDDPATLIAYLSALEADLPRAGLRLRGYSEGIARASSRLAEPDDLARRVAATFVGLATSPFRVQQTHWRAATLRLIALAERWAARAERTNGRTGASRSRRVAVS